MNSGAQSGLAEPRPGQPLWVNRLANLTTPSPPAAAGAPNPKRLLLRQAAIRRTRALPLMIQAVSVLALTVDSPAAQERQPARADPALAPEPRSAPPALAPPAASGSGPANPCPPALATRPLGRDGPLPLWPTPPAAQPAASASTSPDPAPAAAAAARGGPTAPTLPGYAAALRTTSLGWPRLPKWCLWIEPPTDPADPWQQRWLGAVDGAIDAWAPLLPLRRVQDPTAAQLRVWRRRPPLGRDQAGRARASHGRALLQVMAAERQQGQWRLEPSVDVLLSPGQRAEALQATAVHELGHGFGLWGHSPNAADALAASPGPVPVLRPSPGDRATLEWLQRQPTPFGQPLAQPPLP